MDPDSAAGGNHSTPELSAADVVAAQQRFERTLLRKRHVVGVGAGRYLIRKDAPWPSSSSQGTTAMPATPERTMQNSEVRDYSWPCLLVFVDTWLEPGDFGHGPGKTPPSHRVPKTLYLPDGRGVPVCIVRITDPVELRRVPRR